MERKDILNAILSKDATRVAEAKAAIRGMLDARATQFKAEATKFVSKSLFETAQD